MLNVSALAPLALQDGKTSKGLTAAEFGVLMAKLLKAAVRLAGADFAAYFPLGYVIVSCDNDSAHRQFQREQPPAQLNSIPAHSPDIHKVVEHPLKPFNDLWYAEYAADQRCKTTEGAMGLAIEVLNKYDADSVWKDLQTLPATLQAIIDNKGDWAPAALC